VPPERTIAWYEPQLYENSSTSRNAIRTGIARFNVIDLLTRVGDS